jgi:anti-sigma regulatory factor (Ser/Thr protein kinase)
MHEGTGPVGIRVEFEAEPANVAAARALVRRAAVHAGVDPDAAVLATSEVVSNVVRHARTHFELHIVPGEHMLRVEISDGASVIPAVRDLTDEEEGGRGLHVIEAVVESWGVEVTGKGKTVWFEVART